MSITVSMPDEVATEIYWYLLEVLESGNRGSEKATDWLLKKFKPKLQKAWAKDQSTEGD